ncbi:MAG: iron-sulfur cluster assembly scaffold protein [Candidatus Altiarchaeota archaeon]
MYTEKVIEHFQNPRNVGIIENADGSGKVGNPICGDIMLITIKIGENEKKEKVIEDIKFKTLGCAAAIATSSIITELVKGKTIQEALKITKQDIVNSLGGLPKIKIHCSILATEALNEAVYDYLSKNKLQIPKEVQEKHEKIQEELKRLEKQYKEFVAAQEKMFSDKSKNLKCP